MAETFLFDIVDSPIDELAIVADPKGAVRLLSFDGASGRWRKEFARRYPDTVLVEEYDPFGHASALKAYFAGDMEVLDRIPVVKTTSYGALAKKIGEPKAMRAVGLANGANPVAVIVPCHRVIGSDGSLTGFGGGLPRKKWLLAHEAKHTAAKFRLEAAE